MGASGSGGGGVAITTPVPTPLPAQSAVSVQAMPETLRSASADPKLSPEDEKRQQLLVKTDPLIVALMDRLKKPGFKANPEETWIVANEKAELQIWLTEKSDSTIAQLKSIGLEVMFDSRASTLVIGRIPTNKLEALIELKFVRHVAPLRKN